jgi:glycosyltransferase involved in cell wall biosynthesis
VRNIGTVPGLAALTRRVVERAATVIAVSDYLRRELELKVPDARGKTVVIDSGVDLARFAPTASRRDAARPSFLCVGSLTERKNVVRLADAFATLDRGSLIFVGDGPLRGRLEGREGVRIVGRILHDEVPRYLRAADVVCAPSLLEPFGQSILEAMAAGKTVVATSVGGPPEFVPAEAGILVDPLDVPGLAQALEAALAFPAPNEAARAAAALHDVNLQAERVEAILLRASQDRQA